MATDRSRVNVAWVRHVAVERRLHGEVVVLALPSAESLSRAVHSSRRACLTPPPSWRVFSSPRLFASGNVVFLGPRCRSPVKMSLPMPSSLWKCGFSCRTDGGEAITRTAMASTNRILSPCVWLPSLTLYNRSAVTSRPLQREQSACVRPSRSAVAVFLQGALREPRGLKMARNSRVCCPSMCRIDRDSFKRLNAPLVTIHIHDDEMHTYILHWLCNKKKIFVKLSRLAN